MAIQHGLKIRALTSSSDWIKQQAQELGKYFDIRYIPEDLQTQITISIFDRKSAIVVEVGDDSKDSSYEVMGLGTFSNSPSTVSIFETLWKQSGMYEESQNQLHSAETELDKLKQYLNEALEEVASFRKTIRSTSQIS